jgi:microsomal epoxide hydrolase
MPTASAFHVAWSQEEVERVLDLVRAYPWPAAPKGQDGWSFGADETTLRDLMAWWTSGYDWRAALAQLNAYDQHSVKIEDMNIHFVHVVGEAGGRRPLLLSHGWPGSHFEFWSVIGPLAFPSRYGGDTRDAFDLVIPSLPGFGFSSKPDRPIGQRRTARLFNSLMTEVLGYSTYLAQGGDWGGLITSWLGLDYPDSVAAIHLNMIGLRPAGGPKDEAEIAWIGRTQAAMEEMGAYFRLQSSRPQSLAWLGAGNPVGQAAWILERFHDWSDLRTKDLLEVYSRDQLLTNIMIYVMTGSFASSAWYYRGWREDGGGRLDHGQRCKTPTAFANYPGEILYQAPPRSWAERAYEIVRWTDMPAGGHFAAMECPSAFVTDLREWARDIRTVSKTKPPKDHR